MATEPLRVESIDRLTDDTFVVSFSDNTVVILTDEEILENYGSKRMPVRAINLTATPS